MSFTSRSLLSNEGTARGIPQLNSGPLTTLLALLSSLNLYRSAWLRSAAFAMTAWLALPIALAQSSLEYSSLPDAPKPAASIQLADLSLSGISPQAASQQAPPDANSSTPPPPQSSAPAASVQTEPLSPEQKKQAEEQLKKQEQQRILGVIPAFNSVYEGSVPPLTPGQKFKLMFKSTTDPYVFAFAAVTAGIGQAQDSHAAYGQGIQGYAKRFGANYADTADGNFWGNAVLPVVLHEDPRYFRLGHGSFPHRLLYSMSTTVVCRRDDGTRGPNYANVMGNLIAGGISNVYYPEADRGLGQTFQSAATVTAEGMIGAALIEFWPDVTHHYHLKRQAKRDAAAAAARNANPSGTAPQ
ncbi:hypothetical protein ACPOL_1178 [Acidisarcina polymorpha]|uniref:Uncharacterized protein n=1 Tax=Acidisarcina polymorpha TaxID=2211140 RepID=A0A2Z5FVT7_9BACT|nr:hypothetical protein [Acidisarcina polymorpha]AXC10526.1 hypothetical protein ACPOL_1178 [Acidisarcina polymorpha]